MSYVLKYGNERKSGRISFRVTTREKNILNKKASRLGLTLRDYLVICGIHDESYQEAIVYVLSEIQTIINEMEEDNIDNELLCKIQKKVDEIWSQW